MKYLPGFGQLLWALEYPFLERKNFQKDKETIAAVAKVYKSFPFPIQVSLHSLQHIWYRLCYKATFYIESGQH